MVSCAFQCSSPTIRATNVTPSGCMMGNGVGFAGPASAERSSGPARQKRANRYPSRRKNDRRDMVGSRSGLYAGLFEGVKSLVTSGVLRRDFPRRQEHVTRHVESEVFEP